ncbi:MAG: hypothetical protein NXY57DRAFT_969529 [Lentinula lateritia]|nr:MAG: hypothetical protein NXY57DRAFT_969529 [Lentinula lateritia]
MSTSRTTTRTSNTVGSIPVTGWHPTPPAALTCPSTPDPDDEERELELQLERTRERNRKRKEEKKKAEEEARQKVEEERQRQEAAERATNARRLEEEAAVTECLSAEDEWDSSEVINNTAVTPLVPGGRERRREELSSSQVGAAVSPMTRSEPKNV